MREFDFKAEYQKLLTPEVVAYLTQIHEYKGQQNLFIEAKADALAFASSESHGSDLRLAVNAGLHACDAVALRKAVCRARQITKPRPTLIDISGTSLRALGQNDSSNALSGFADKL